MARRAGKLYKHEEISAGRDRWVCVLSVAPGDLYALVVLSLLQSRLYCRESEHSRGADTQRALQPRLIEKSVLASLN
ncbi:unnamed protein product [Thelazia callipaeda]|uniref:Uncharacterized protein n=1 Tax=Thelazia callipaeda TaxID=103827 RepID=A0A0N5D4E7_THECL|nr:unnamed protein product [Thelazia callipaeda]